MKIAIWIVVECNNRNIVYPTVVAMAKNKIREYLGSRNCAADDDSIPVVEVTCEVTQDDINSLNSIIDDDAIHLVVIIGAKDSKRVDGDIIDLREE